MVEAIKNAIVGMDQDKIVALTKKALDEGVSAEEILNKGLVPAMEQVGDEYEKGNIYVPEMLLAAEAMKMSMEIIKPILTAAGVKSLGCAVLGTVEGDLHDIGVNLVAMMLGGAGFEVVNLGPDTPARDFVKALKENNASILGLSALLTTTMPYMAEIIKVLEENGMRNDVKVMIGGAPVTEEYAQKISADGYAPDAAAAVRLANKLVQK